MGFGLTCNDGRMEATIHSRQLAASEETAKGENLSNSLLSFVRTALATAAEISRQQSYADWVSDPHAFMAEI